MKKVLVIAGPTASGKTALGLDFALKFKGEIISGDSQQVYRQLNIGTAKASLEQQALVPHHLIDIVDYQENYSVADFQRNARVAIEDISQRGRLPILVGGTGFYLKAALYDYEFKSEETPVETYESFSNEDLYALLKQVDPVSLQKIHLNNRKRLIRAVQIAKSGQLKSEIEAQQTHQPIYDVFFIVLTYPKEILDQRIQARTHSMIESGLLAEVQQYFGQDKQRTYQSFQGIGYKEWLPYLNNEATLQATEEKICIATRQFAKRQMTWFRHQFKPRFVDMTDTEDMIKLSEEIPQWMKETT